MKDYQEMGRTRTAEFLAKAAMVFGKAAANSTCCYIYHQPKMPEGLKKLRKN